jgi:hypothetical protein
MTGHNAAVPTLMIIAKMIAHRIVTRDLTLHHESVRIGCSMTSGTPRISQLG